MREKGFIYAIVPGNDGGWNFILEREEKWVLHSQEIMFL